MQGCSPGGREPGLCLAPQATWGLRKEAQGRCAHGPGKHQPRARHGAGAGGKTGLTAWPTEMEFSSIAAKDPLFSDIRTAPGTSIDSGRPGPRWHIHYP